MGRDEIAERTERAVAAAVAAARNLGLTVEAPRVLHDVFSVIVHLAPAPVAARVPTVLPAWYGDSGAMQITQQQAELAVASWLADDGHPVVAPSPLVPRAPVQRDGFSMTFWAFVEESPEADPDLELRMAETARLHAALRNYDGAQLGFCTPFSSVAPGLAALERSPDLIAPPDLRRARREWAVLAPVLESRPAFEAAFPAVEVQTIHGDAPYYNMVPTRHGLLWADFELVTLGTVESDLAMAGPQAVAAYNAAAGELGIGQLDQQVLAVTEAAARLASIAALSMAPQLPLLVSALAPVVDQWRGLPELTEIGGP